MAPNFDKTTGAILASPRSCVLLVEDEMLIRMIVSDDEAMMILTSSIQIDLIVSDVHMPGSIDGIGLLEASRELFPALPVIIVSGHFSRDEALTKGAYGFVRKPFAVEGVVNAVREALLASNDSPTLPLSKLLRLSLS